ncbi:MAG: hypothetical protein ABI321_21035 [Polyangia bacterium]
MIRALLLLTTLACAAACGGGDDGAVVDMRCGAITCGAGMVADFASCSCKAAPDASVPQDLAEID